MTRSKHGRERKHGSARSASHSHRTDRRADRRASRRAERSTGHRSERRSERKTERRSERKTERRTERSQPERHHIVADVEPLDVDGVRTVAVGSVAWIVAFVAMLPFIGTLRDHDRLSWLWICIAGFGLGLIGLEYCRRRRNLLTAEPGRRRTEASRFGAAGD
jgi:Flp pilus assembly protein TadB